MEADLHGKAIEPVLQLEAGETWLLADSARLQQVFWNVLSNACKFSPREARITIRSFNPPGTPATLAIEIKDQGIGMTPAEVACAFEPFAQGNHSHAEAIERFGGLGLGLAISQQLTALLGGTIGVSSEGTGQGCTFLLTFPLAPPEVEGAGPRLRVVLPPPASLRILLVEDHRDTRGALTHLLMRHGHTVTAAASVQEAMAQLHCQTFDLLVSDLGLPDGDGFSIMRQARQQHPQLVGVAISGFGAEDDRRRSNEAGFAAHLVKPIVVEVLFETIACVLAKSVDASAKEPLPGAVADARKAPGRWLSAVRNQE